jgi:hypothetical protein
MLTQIRTSFHRAQGTLLQDAIGVAALMTMLVVALHLPGLT